jgi:hypothetical protein
LLHQWERDGVVTHTGVDSASGTYSYLLASGRGGEALIIER